MGKRVVQPRYATHTRPRPLLTGHSTHISPTCLQKSGMRPLPVRAHAHPQHTQPCAPISNAHTHLRAFHPSLPSTSVYPAPKVAPSPWATTHL